MRRDDMVNRRDWTEEGRGKGGGREGPEGRAKEVATDGMCSPFRRRRD